MQQLKAGFKRTITWNKYQSEPILKTCKRYLNQLIDPSFQGENKIFVSSFENDGHRRRYKRYFLSIVEVNDLNVMTDGKNFFDQPEKKHEAIL